MWDYNTKEAPQRISRARHLIAIILRWLGLALLPQYAARCHGTDGHVPASVSFFDTLGVLAAVGRTFGNDDEQRSCSIVLSHKFWAAAFTSDPSISRMLGGMLYGIRSADPEVLISVSGTLLAAAALAMLLPARRAANIDPLVALREE